MAIQDKFNSKNVIYKITSDVDLEGGTLTVPAGCTLDFQGGAINNGTVKGNGAYIVGETSRCSAKFEDVVYFTSGQEAVLDYMVVDVDSKIAKVKSDVSGSLDTMQLKFDYIKSEVSKVSSKADLSADVANETAGRIDTIASGIIDNKKLVFNQDGTVTWEEV